MVQLPKGTRDFAPEEKIVRDEILSAMKSIFERYGFCPFETPIIERFDVLSSKYTGGAEILKETFQLKDQGGRELGLRYDLTVPLARFMAMNPRMKMPFKRYHVGDVFRDGPIATARYRQFTQCDVDIIGATSMKADAEVVGLVSDVFSALGFNFDIKVNNRKILNSLLDACGVAAKDHESAILSIDKLEKFGWDTVAGELKQKGISADSIDSIKKALTTKDTMNYLKKTLSDQQGVEEIEEMLGYLDVAGVKVTFDVSLARGLAYYTGTILEVVLKGSKVKSSVCGGGRYDEMIGSLMGKGQVCAMGVSFGLDRMYDALLEKRKETAKTVTSVFVVPIGCFEEGLKVAKALRDANINTEIDLLSKNPSKNIQYANAKGIPYVVFLGEEEVKQKKVKLKDMNSGEENTLSVSDVIKKISE